MDMNALRSEPAHTHSSIIVDFNNETHMRLLERAWDELLVVGFPNPKDQEHIEDWVRRARDPNVVLSIPIIGENLDDPDKAVLKGMSVGTFYKKSQCLFLDFTVAANEFRGQGIGEELKLKRIFNSVAHNNGNPVQGLFAEIINPFMCEESDKANALRRSKHFTANGNARIVPIAYTQPGLSGQPTDDGLVLLTYKMPNGSFATPHKIADALKDQYKHFGIADEPDLNRMLRELKGVYPALAYQAA